MNPVAVTIKTVEKTGVLHGIADKLFEKQYYVVYTHLFLEDDSGRIYMEIEGVDDVDKLVDYISKIPNVISVKSHDTLEDTYGKRVIVLGDGDIMAKTLQGAILEAELHNTQDETISVDGMVIGGGNQISEALSVLTKLPRIHALVLAGSMMGGEIANQIKILKSQNNHLSIISVEMLGNLDSVVDLVINDPIHAGAMAVKLVSDKSSYDDDLIDNKFLNKNIQ